MVVVAVAVVMTVLSLRSYPKAGGGAFVLLIK